MAELEPGHPDELIKVLRNWLDQKDEGKLPAGMDRTEWAVRQFINYWHNPARRAIDSIEKSLLDCIALCAASAPHGDIADELELARQTLQEDLRDHLGLYDWNAE